MAPLANAVRLDKWLWAVRLYKTRTQAAEACRNSKVSMGGQPVKASREVRVTDIIHLQTGEILRTVKVLAILDKRVGAAIVKDYMEDMTPPEELQKPRLPDFNPVFARPKGAGRPTKKERRQIDELQADQ